MNQQYNAIKVIALVLIVGLAGWFIYNHYNSGNTGLVISQTTTATKTTANAPVCEAGNYIKVSGGSCSVAVLASDCSVTNRTGGTNILGACCFAGNGVYTCYTTPVAGSGVATGPTANIAAQAAITGSTSAKSGTTTPAQN